MSYTLGAAAQVETLSTTNNAGTGAIDLHRQRALPTALPATTEPTSLNGGGGADYAGNGRGGNDLLYVDNAGDVVIEGAGGGSSDRVLASVSYVLAQPVPRSRSSAPPTTPGAGAINLYRQRLGQLHRGQQRRQRAQRRSAAPTRSTASAATTCSMSTTAGDVVIEGAGGGSDRVFASSVSYALGAGRACRGAVDDQQRRDRCDQPGRQRTGQLDRGQQRRQYAQRRGRCGYHERPWRRRPGSMSTMPATWSSRRPAAARRPGAGFGELHAGSGSTGRVPQHHQQRRNGCDQPDRQRLRQHRSLGNNGANVLNGLGGADVPRTASAATTCSTSTRSAMW